MDTVFTYLVLAALAVLCGYLDRLRGSDAYDLTKGHNSVDTLVYGAVIGLMLNLPNPLVLGAFAVLWWIGEKPGWGEPLGSALHGRPMRMEKLEWWQVGPLAKSPQMACLARGILWGLPTLLLLPWTSAVAVMPVAMGFAFWLAPQIAAKLDPATQWTSPLPKTDKGIWDKGEAIRGWLLGAFLLLAYIVT